MGPPFALHSIWACQPNPPPPPNVGGNGSVQKFGSGLSQVTCFTVFLELHPFNFIRGVTLHPPNKCRLCRRAEQSLRGLGRQGLKNSLSQSCPLWCACFVGPQGSLQEVGVDVCSSCPQGLECFEGSDMQNWWQGRRLRCRKSVRKSRSARDLSAGH